jgi:hypothetical protein
VRGQVAAESDHYAIGNGTVHDNWSGLTWIQSPSASTVLPSTVGSYCAGQTLSGGGWRAPSTNELETLFGDLSSPDSVTLDSTAFEATLTNTDGKLGSSNFQVSGGDGGGPTLWIFACGERGELHSAFYTASLT